MQVSAVEHMKYPMKSPAATYGYNQKHLKLVTSKSKSFHETWSKNAGQEHQSPTKRHQTSIDHRVT